MAQSKPWADKPLPLLETPSMRTDVSDHPAHYIANEMAWAHNAMIRGLNAIYLQARNIGAADAADFLFFTASWSAWVMHHHQIEENIMFSSFENVSGVVKGSLQYNADQHHGFVNGLEALHKYALETDAARYDGTKVCELIDVFKSALREHLADEIDTLWSMDSVSAGSAESKKLLQIYKRCEAEASKQDKHVVPPMVLGLCDKTFEGGNSWPAMPVGSAYFVHYIFARKHRGAWRFLPCDTWSQPRQLPFAK